MVLPFFISTLSDVQSVNALLIPVVPKQPFPHRQTNSPHTSSPLRVPTSVQSTQHKDPKSIETVSRRRARTNSGVEAAVATDSTRRRMARAKGRGSKSRVESTTTFTRKRNNYPDPLSREEEYEATYKLRALRAAVRIRDQLVSSHSEELSTWQPTEEEWAEACGMDVMQLRRTMQEGQKARTMLVSANGGLVNTIAQKYFNALRRGMQGTGSVGTILTYQDFVQEGNLGLMEAAERFDPERGFRFSTYASYWVRQRILQSISDYSRTIRLPAHGKDSCLESLGIISSNCFAFVVHWMIRKINRAKVAIEQEIGRQPTQQELAQYLEISVEKLELYADSSRSVLSLEVPLRSGGYKNDDTRTLGDFISSDAPTPVEDAETESLREDIREVVNELDERERDVLVARFGLDDGSPRSVAETSRDLGISRDRVRIIEARALNKLRNPQRSYKLKNYVAGTVEEHVEEVNLSPERIWSI